MGPNQTAEPVLRFESVSKIYTDAGGRSSAVLKDVSFVVDAGTKLAITGRSGTGKSTLLHLAAGIDVPSHGSVYFDGREVDALSERERTLLRRNEIGLVFQFFHLLPHLSVWENVLLPAWIAADRRGKTSERARELLDRVGLADQADQPAQQLSGGEMQRVAICRSVLRRPRLLLADEPTGNLDDENATLVMELLVQLVRESGGSLVYVTHSEELAARADVRLRLTRGGLESE